MCHFDKSISFILIIIHCAGTLSQKSEKLFEYNILDYKLIRKISSREIEETVKRIKVRRKNNLIIF